MDEAQYLPSLNSQSAQAALASQRRGEVVFALVAEASRGSIAVLQQAARDRGLLLVGAVFPSLLRGGFVQEGAWLVSVSGVTSYALLPRQGRDVTTMAREIAGSVVESPGYPPSLFLVFDGMIPNVASHLDALYLELADTVHYFGVCAGSETFQPIESLFDAEQAIADGILCLTLPPGLETVLAHGYRPPANAVTATSTTGNKITTINWKPAFEVYSQQVREIYGVALTPANFYEYAVHFPFGISLANGQSLVRIPVGLDDQGAIVCVGEVPENALLTMLEAPIPGSTDTIETLARVHRGPGAAWPTFYCAGRRMHLAARADDELAALDATLGEVAFGALSLGEIGSLDVGGYPSFHNGALVCSRRRIEQRA